MDGIMKFLSVLALLAFSSAAGAVQNYCGAVQTTINSSFTQTNCTTTLLNCTVSTGTNHVLVTANIRVGLVSTEKQFRVVLMRDSTQIYTTNNGQAGNPDLGTANGQYAFEVTDLPGAGSHVYKMNVCLPNSGVAIVGPAIIYAIEFLN